MSNWNGPYVAHECRKCGCIFIAEDYTNVTTLPPKWRYCKECSEELGIDYHSQKPSDRYTEEDKMKIKERIEKMRLARNNK